MSATKNDGGSADYYQLPAGAAELQDLIEHKQMNFAVGNIFKAAYRLGAENSLSDRSRDLRKIKWFADRELQRLAVEEPAPLRYPPAHPFKHKDEVEVCATCQSWGRGCQGREDVTACDKYIPPSPPADPWAERDLCRRCANPKCDNAGQECKFSQCDHFKAAE